MARKSPKPNVTVPNALLKLRLCQYFHYKVVQWVSRAAIKCVLKLGKLHRSCQEKLRKEWRRGKGNVSNFKKQK